MFTVLIAEKEHINAIQRENKLFFEPFLENKELAFCSWNPTGQTLRECVPGLLDAVGRRKSWRAVIINNCTIKSSKTRNPFDVVDRSALDAIELPKPQPEQYDSIDDWETAWKEYYNVLTVEKEKVYTSALEYPFQKLSTWLCFRPSDYVLNDVKEKQDVHDWAMEKLGRDEIKPSFKLELMERNQYKRELRIKENLRRAFLGESFLDIAYPTEVHCISLRSAENNYFDPEAYWNVRQESEYSAFADRNMYFDRMRFMVFDLLSHSHRNFRADYIRFLATILVFAANPVPSSAMQARRLYVLESESDDAPLCTLVSSYDRKLAATYEVIETEMERIRSEIPGELTDKAAEALFCSSKAVTVVLDASCEPEKVLAEKDYGLFYDQPENESVKWKRDYRTSEKALSYIVKQQSRSVRKGVIQMHTASKVDDVNISRLTHFQIDDIRDYTNAAEDEMIVSAPSTFSDIAKYEEAISKEAEKVSKLIKRRMTKQTTVYMASVCLGLYLICILPFIIANFGSMQMLTTAGLLSLGMLGILAIIMLVSLFILRSSVLNAIENYNKTAHGMVDDIQSSMKRFSEYLSAVCNVRRGHAVQNYARNNLDGYTRSLRIRKKHQEDIRKKRAQLAEGYGDFFVDRSGCDEAMCHPYEYNFDEVTDFAYPAPFLAGDCRQIEFINNSNLVSVPSSYITRILVRMEGIYE